MGGGGGSSGGGSKRNTYLSQMTNQKAKNIVDQLYRPGAEIGDGGTADALIYEAKTGNKVGGKKHYDKAIQRVKNIERVLREEKLSDTERNLLKSLLKKLKEAIEAWDKLIENGSRDY